MVEDTSVESSFLLFPWLATVDGVDELEEEDTLEAPASVEDSLKLELAPGLNVSCLVCFGDDRSYGK